MYTPRDIHTSPRVSTSAGSGALQQSVCRTEVRTLGQPYLQRSDSTEDSLVHKALASTPLSSPKSKSRSARHLDRHLIQQQTPEISRVLVHGWAEQESYILQLSETCGLVGYHSGLVGQTLQKSYAGHANSNVRPVRPSRLARLRMSGQHRQTCSGQAGHAARAGWVTSASQARSTTGQSPQQN